MKTLQKGFTLIELMIVVAIIGILAAVALPAYQDYTARSQVSEAMTLAEGAKISVTEYWTSKASLPSTNAMAGLASAASVSGKYVSKVEVGTNGLITATMKSTAGSVAKGLEGKTLELKAATVEDKIVWTCKTGATNPINPKHLPTSCRN